MVEVFGKVPKRPDGELVLLATDFLHPSWLVPATIAPRAASAKVRDIGSYRYLQPCSPGCELKVYSLPSAQSGLSMASFGRSSSIPMRITRRCAVWFGWRSDQAQCA